MPAPLHARRLIPGLLTLAALAAATRASAWPTDIYQNLPIMTVGNVGTYVQVAADGSGGTFITWNDTRTGSAGFDIYAQHVLSTGIVDPLWPVNGLAVCTAVGDQAWPRVVSDGAGGAYLCWMDPRTGTYDIYAHHVLASGLDPAWPANGRAVCIATGGQFQPRLFADGNGVTMTWFDQRTGAGNDDIYVQRLQPNGTLPVHGWPVNGKAICTATGPQSDPCIVNDDAGGAIIAWTDQRSGTHVYAQHVQITGLVDSAWPTDGRLICSQSSNRPLAVRDLAGGAVIVWSDNRVASSSDLYAARIQIGGALDPGWPVDGVAVCTAAGTQIDVAIDSDGAGGAYLAWDDRRFNGVDSDIYAHHLLSTGAVAAAFPANGLGVCTDAGSQQLPSIVFTGDGAIVAWAGPMAMAQHVLAAGSVDGRWPAGGEQVAPGGNQEWAPSVCGDLWNGAIIAWQDSRGHSEWDVYAQRVSNGSSLGMDLALFASFAGVSRASCLWADLNGDSFLDLLVSGTDGSVARTDAYRWNGSAFSTLPTGLPGLFWSSMAAGDYDGDGDIDLAVCGTNGVNITRIYRNNGNGTWSDIFNPLPAVSRGVVAWGDLDGDGDLDLLIAGQLSDGSPMAQVYSNDNGFFSDAGQLLTGVYFSDAAWADFDNDGDQDLAICGWDGSAPTTHVYLNDHGVLVDSGFFLYGVEEGELEWTDFDSDGDLDLVVMGWDGFQRRADLYYNIGGNLSPFSAWSPAYSSSAVAAGDLDNDGEDDYIAAGYSGSGGVSRVERHDGTAVRDAGIQLPGVYFSATALGDFNQDGNLDLALVGTTGASSLANVYTSYATTPNAPPSMPLSPLGQRNGNAVTFSWSAATDDHTPAAALTYNLRVGTTPGGNQIMSAMAASDGRRRVAQIGNVGERLSFTLPLPPGQYYWGVQAIDGAFLGSAFTTDATTAVGDHEVTGVAGLLPASPNPFRVQTGIAFTLPRAGAVDLAVFDAAGRRVRELVHGEHSASVGHVTWDGRDAAGAAVANGLYLVRLECDGRAWTGKVVLAR